MSVIVQRQPADKPGPDIVSSVLTDDTSKLERGRRDINYYSTDRGIESLTLVPVTFRKPGKLIGVTSKNGRTVGKVTEFSHREAQAVVEGERVTVIITTIARETIK